jgi:hypothetical protein
MFCSFIDADDDDSIFGSRTSNQQQQPIQAPSQTSINSQGSQKPKISTQTVNNLIKRIASQNSSTLLLGSRTTKKSIAASSTSAVASASSLASSLNKLNFN